MTRTRTTIAVCLAVVCIGARAHAQQSTEASARRALVEQAEQESDAGNHARAIDLAMQAGQIRMSPSLRLLIAEEQLAAGQLGAAFVSARSCAREAERDATIANRGAIVRRCHEISDGLRQRGGFVIVNLAGAPPPDLHVQVDGVDIDANMLGAPVLVRPGPVRIDARARGIPGVQRSVSVTQGDTVTVDVALQRMPTAAVGGGPFDTNESSVAFVPSTASRDLLAPPMHRRTSVGPYLLMGGGALSIGASILFFELRQVAVGNCTLEPHTIACPTEADAARAQGAYTYQTLSAASLGIGVAAIVGGIVWLAIDRRSPDRTPPRRASIDFVSTPQGALLGVHGAL
jgi:hypothetical protein